MINDPAQVAKHLLKRHCSTSRALDALTDITITPLEALRRFAKIAKRMKPVSQGFLLFIGESIRATKMERAAKETEIARWADDGGRA